MNKIEFLATQLPYGLKLMQSCKNWFTPEPDRVVTLTGLVYEDSYIEPYLFYRDENTAGNFKLSDFTPIVRPLDSLVKECVQADYNDGKPFVPIEELRECAICDADYMWLSAIEDDLASVDEKLQVGPFHLIMLLLKFHYWPNMPEGEEVIWVNSTFNPYGI